MLAVKMSTGSTVQFSTVDILLYHLFLPIRVIQLHTYKYVGVLLQHCLVTLSLTSYTVQVIRARKLYEVNRSTCQGLMNLYGLYVPIYRTLYSSSHIRERIIHNNFALYYISYFKTVTFFNYFFFFCQYSQ